MAIELLAARIRGASGTASRGRERAEALNDHHVSAAAPIDPREAKHGLIVAQPAKVERQRDRLVPVPAPAGLDGW